MSPQVYRYGRKTLGRGLFVGVAWCLPRGVRREDYASRGYFDIWMPLLAPSRGLVAAYRGEQISFARFARRYRVEMRSPEARHAIRLLAAVACRLPVHLGCSCADAARCHRTVLQELMADAMTALPRRSGKAGEFFSPACSMPEIED